MKKNILWIIFPLCTLFSCTEKIDQSARYVFQDYTVTSYLETHEQYSTYYQLLDMVPVSAISKTTVKQLVSARGNYTVFAPTNEAVTEYIDSLYDDTVNKETQEKGYCNNSSLPQVSQWRKPASHMHPLANKTARILRECRNGVLQFFN